VYLAFCLQGGTWDMQAEDPVQCGCLAKWNREGHSAPRGPQHWCHGALPSRGAQRRDKGQPGARAPLLRPREGSDGETEAQRGSIDFSASQTEGVKELGSTLPSAVPRWKTDVALSDITDEVASRDLSAALPSAVSAPTMVGQGYGTF
jgi:hypothetical protein